jgi:ABC-type multidrug transport system fused ATPase/permease subunit
MLLWVVPPTNKRKSTWKHDLLSSRHKIKISEMDFLSDEEIIAGLTSFLFLFNIYRLFSLSKPVDYQDIDNQHPTSSEKTLLELAIIFLNFLLLSCNVMNLILCFVTGDFRLPLLLSDIVYFYHSISAVCFVIQIYLLQKNNSPRYYFVQTTFSIAAQAILLKDLENAEYLYILVSKISLGLLVAFITLEFFKPAKDAHLINADRDSGRAPSLEDTASPYSLMTFSWVNPLLNEGYRKSLESEDLNHLSKKDKMKNIAKEWAIFKSNNNSIVWDATLFTKQYAIYQILVSIITTTLDFSKPFFINLLLVWIQNRKPGEPYDFGFYLLIGMFASSILKQILDAQIYLSGRHWGMQLRAIFVYEIFKKSLRRTGGSALADDEQGQKATQGKIVSLMSSDTNSIRWFLTDIHSILIDIPLSIAISISGLLYVMGTPALAGLVVIIISGPISSWAMTRLYKILKAVRSFVDKRIQVTNEALLGIRIIKYMSWESQFVKKIWQARENELNSRLQLLMSNLLVTLIAWGSSILVTFTSFFFYTVNYSTNQDCGWKQVGRCNCIYINISSLDSFIYAQRYYPANIFNLEHPGYYRKDQLFLEGRKFR